MDLSTAYYNPTRNTVHVHGRQYTVKQQRGRYYIHAANKQITVTAFVLKKDESDPVYDYVFRGGFVNFPCPAVEYWIERHRLKRRISIAEFKKQKNIRIKVNLAQTSICHDEENSIPVYQGEHRRAS